MKDLEHVIRCPEADRDKKYFGSEYNKYLSEKCTKKMTANNMDCITYKASKKMLRIIECKHKTEQMSDSQKRLLSILSEIFEVYNKTDSPKYKAGVYVVTGEYPYEEAEVTKVSTGEVKYMSKNEFNSWSEFGGD